MGRSKDFMKDWYRANPDAWDALPEAKKAALWQCDPYFVEPPRPPKPPRLPGKIGRPITIDRTSVVQTIKDGKSTSKEIANKYNISVDYVYRVAKQIGAPRLPRGPKADPQLEQRNASIVRDMKNGKTQQAIGEQHNITRQRIQQIADKAGEVQRRKDGKEDFYNSVAEAITLGIPIDDISATFKINNNAIKKIARRRKLPQPKRIDKNHARDSAIMEMLKTHTYKQVAKASGMTISNISRIRRRMQRTWSAAPLHRTRRGS